MSPYSGKEGSNLPGVRGNVACCVNLSWLSCSDPARLKECLTDLCERTMSGVASSLATAGKVVKIDECFRAHVQYRGAEGQNAHLQGPRRPDPEQAGFPQPVGRQNYSDETGKHLAILNGCRVSHCNSSCSDVHQLVSLSVCPFYQNSFR